MTDTETRSVLRTLQSAYPYRYRNMSKRDADDMVRQWSQLEPYEKVKQAVNKAIANMRYHPTISEIREIMTESDDPYDMLNGFRSVLRFRISQLQNIIMKLGKSESETDGNRVDKARQELDEIHAKYGHILEGQL